jgi:hypothetical protein
VFQGFPIPSRSVVKSLSIDTLCFIGDEGPGSLAAT